jgi:uncharacterized protein YecE (DUF72 family)
VTDQIASAGAVRIGTSGWSYPSGRGTWNGIFYPVRGERGFRAGDELRYYAEHFDTVEVNATFYRPPVAAVTARWLRETPREFEFSVKLHQKFSHVTPIGRGPSSPPATAARQELPHPTPEDVDEFKAGIEPLADGGKLGVLLLQFPPSFRRTPEASEYLRGLLRAFREYPVAVELRHRSWSDAEADTLALLDEFDAAWVQIDEPKFRFSIRQTLMPNISRFYYMRLHGRNAEQWWKPDAPEDRYNYLYSPEELRPIAEVVALVRPEVRKAYLYLNNHFAAKAVVNAVTLKHQLGMQVEGEFQDRFVRAYPDVAELVRVPGDDFLFR